MNRLVNSLWVFVCFTILVWATRIYNLFRDNEISVGEKTWSLFLAIIFLLGAVAITRILVGSWRDRNLKKSRLVPAFCIWTMTFWVVRTVGIVVANHQTGFKLVHVSIAVVFILLSLVVNRLKTMVSNI